MESEFMRKELDCTEKPSPRYKGVYEDMGNHRWRAYIWIDGRRTLLGSFSVIHDAAAEYNRVALARFGDKAFLNDIPKDHHLPDDLCLCEEPGSVPCADCGAGC